MGTLTPIAMNLQSPSACNTGQNFILFFINVSIARKAPVNDTIPILLLYKKHAQYKNNAALQRKIVIQALETAIFN